MDDDLEPPFLFDDMVRWQRGDLPPEWFDTQVRISIRRAKKQDDKLVALIAWAKVNDPAMHARLMALSF